MKDYNGVPASVGFQEGRGQEVKVQSPIIISSFHSQTSHDIELSFALPFEQNARFGINH